MYRNKTHIIDNDKSNCDYLRCAVFGCNQTK